MKSSKTLTVDLRMLHASGIGTYLRNLVPLVITALPDTRFHFLGKLSEMSGYGWARANHVTLIDCHAPVYSVAEQFELLRKTPKDTTLFWSPHYNIPLLHSGKLLVTVHDIFHLAMPQYVGSLHKRLYAKAMFAAIRYKSDAVLTVSKFTKQELVRLGGQQEHKIHVIHNGVDASWFHTQDCSNPHPKPFILYVGNVKPHKNLATLVRAFGSIKEKIPHDLVIVGEGENLITKDKTVRARAAGLGSRVHFTGYLKDDLVRQYFSHADTLVLPSLYEGFGLPPLEAMACGCPVLVSNVASLPEICGDAALYCDPYNAEDIADEIRLLTDDSSLREELQRKGKERVKRFTWDKCAEQTVDAIERLFYRELR